MSIPPGLRPGRTAYVNVRLLDPASGLDLMGALLTEGETIADFGPRLLNDGIPEGVQVIDGQGACLAPGLVDMRVQLCEPGEEHKETLQSGSEAAAAGGVTAVVALPNTEPVIDEVSGIEFIARRAREVKLVKVYSHAAVTKGLAGKELCEIGLLKEAAALNPDRTLAARLRNESGDYLLAAYEAQRSSTNKLDADIVAHTHKLDPDMMRRWMAALDVWRTNRQAI